MPKTRKAKTAAILQTSRLLAFYGIVREPLSIGKTHAISTRSLSEITDTTRHLAPGLVTDRS